MKGGNASINYISFDSLLFELLTTTKKETALSAIPETCVNKAIMLYDSSFFAGHQSLIKIYLTIGDMFFIPGLIHYLRSYIKSMSYLSAI